MKSFHLLQAEYWNGENSLSSARFLIAAKMNHQRHLLMERSRRKRHLILSNLAQIQRSEQEVLQAVTRPQAMLHEARVARTYLRGLSNCGFFASSWTRLRHADDSLNRTLDIASHWLARNVRTKLEEVGLTPEIGVLHAPRHGMTALVYDLMELMRQPVIELVVFSKMHSHEWHPGELCKTLQQRMDNRLPYMTVSFEEYLLGEIAKYQYAIKNQEPWHPDPLSWSHKK